MKTNHPRHAHNAFFTWFASNLHYARALLSCILPLALLQKLDLSTLRVVSPDHTDSRLRNHRADILFEVRYHSKKKLLIYLLLEHKSYRDTKASFQILRYIVHRTEDRLRQKEPCRCIIPVVIYNGLKPWAAARSLHQIFQVPEECSEMFPQFRVSVLDLPRMDGKILQGSADFLAAAKLLRSSFQPDLADQMPGILVGLKKHLLAAADGRETPDSPVPAILRYATARIPLPELQQIIAQTFQGETMIQGQAFKSAAEVWYEEGEAKGRIEGRKDGLLRGRLIGQIQLLQQLLKRPVASDAELEQLPLEDLRTLFEDLQRQQPDQN
jgi:predicted transposase/invertase (TIGR01784 family)